jgi:hypothetical protein
MIVYTLYDKNVIFIIMLHQPLTTYVKVLSIF